MDAKNPKTPKMPPVSEFISYMEKIVLFTKKQDDCTQNDYRT